MSVNPGFGGQKFIGSVLPKISKVREFINDKIGSDNKEAPLLEVDGGINLENIQKIAKAGTDIFVMGSAIFNAKDPYEETIAQAKALLNQI
jgi:ribulose-phosphate 3-epimerase